MADSELILRELLDEIAKENKIENYDVKTEPISTEGANFTSHLYSVTISNDYKELKLFAKVIVIGEIARAQGMDIFTKTEPFIYTQLSKIYRQLEEKFEIPEKHKIQFPKLHGENQTPGVEILVLEDVAAQGYNVHNRFKPIDRLYAFNAVKRLAKFHALSMAFEQEQPEEFKNVLELVKFEPVMNDSFRDVISNTLQTAFSLTEQKNRQRLQNYFSKLDMDDFLHFMQPLRRPVLIHGDFKISNIMYKVDDDKNYDMKIVDYQLVQGSSVAIDLLYFIFTGTDEEFRSKHYFPLLDHYYAQLSLAMRRLALEPSEIYSRDDFEYELEQKLPYGLFVAVMLLPMVLVDVEDAPIIDKNSDISSFHVKNAGNLYRDRLNGIINDFVRWKVI